MNDKDLMKKLSTMTNEEIEQEAKELMNDGIPKELIKPLWEDEMLKEQIANTTDEDRERFRKSFELTLEMLNEEMENSVKRKKRLMRLEKEHLVDMVFNLERRNEFLLHNLSEVEKMYNKLKEEKWYGFESYAEGGSLDAVQLTKEEFAIVRKIFDEGETLYDEGYSGSISLFGSEDGYDSKLDLMRAYAKEASFLHTEDIIDKDIAAIIEKEQDEGLFEEEEE